MGDEMQAYIPSSNTEVEQTAWTGTASIICQSFEWVYLELEIYTRKGQVYVTPFFLNSVCMSNWENKYDRHLK